MDYFKGIKTYDDTLARVQTMSNDEIIELAKKHKIIFDSKRQVTDASIKRIAEYETERLLEDTDTYKFLIARKKQYDETDGAIIAKEHRAEERLRNRITYAICFLSIITLVLASILRLLQ